MTFNDRLKIGFEFREFIEINDINTPLRMKTRRKLFIKWDFNR